MSAIHITKEKFEELLKGDLPLVADFWAEWCGPCRMLAPVIDELAQALEGRAAVGKINVDECPELAEKFGIMNIPAILFFKDGEVVDKALGFRNKMQLVAMAEKIL